MAVFQPSGRHVLQSMKPCDLSTCTRSEIKEYFENSYDLYETLFKALEDESAFYKCSDRLRLPLIFYFGHTAAVYVNKLVLGGLLKERINFYFETLFETGVDEMSWDDTENYRMGGSFVWPKVAEVAEYRKKARQVILDVIENTPLELPVTQESIWWAVFMGFEHERIHFETSSVLIRQMPVELVRRPKGWKYGPLKTGDPVLSNPLIEITEQSVSMGKPENFPSYGWDNEYGQWNVTVPAFIASKYLITNREYLEFVNDRGYENSKYWTKKGWQWKQFRKLHHPSFWVCGNNCKTGSGSDLATYSHCNLKLTDVNHNELPENYIINGNDDVSNGVMNGDHQHGWSNGVVNGEHQHGLSNGVMNGDHQHGLSNGVVNGEHQHGLSNGVMNGDHQHGLSNGVMNGDHQHGLSNGVVNGDHQHGLSNGDHQQGLSNGVVNGDHQHGWSNGVMNGDHQHGLSNGVMNGDHQHGLSNGVVNGDHQHGWSNGVMNGDHYLSGEANGSINGSPDRNALLNGIAVNGYSKAINSPYKFRAMFEVMDMPMDWPAEVNYHEAKAFCAWKGSDYRLPTEAEHHVMRGPQKPLSDGTACDIIFQDKIEANINMAYGSSTPVNMYPPTETGFCDVFGNVWEWVEDHFNGFGEFKAHLLYDDFSSPCFDGRHNMIMGGSWVSTGDEASRFARYAFRRHFFQHLGFRVAQTVADSPPVRLVETPVFVLGVGVEDNAVTVPGIDVSKAYVNTTNLQYHDDSEEFMCSEVVSNYGDLLGVESDADCCKQLAQLCKEAIHKHNKCPVKRALDIMCSVGRFSYELSKCLEEVIAIDHSGRLLDAALKIRQGKSLEIKGAKDFPSINIPLDEIQGNVDRVRFQQFTWLPNEIGVFDMIVMSSLKRLANPEAWLVRLWEILNPHGLLVIKTNALWDLESLIAVLGTK